MNELTAVGLGLGSHGLKPFKPCAQTLWSKTLERLGLEGHSLHSGWRILAVNSHCLKLQTISGGTSPGGLSILGLVGEAYYVVTFHGVRLQRMHLVLAMCPQT